MPYNVLLLGDEYIDENEISPLKNTFEIWKHPSYENNLQEIHDQFGTFFTCELAYLVALAIIRGANTIAIMGYKFTTETEIRYKQDSVSYMLGIAIARGTHIIISKDVNLLFDRSYAFPFTEIADMTNPQYRNHFLQRIQNK